MRCRHLGGDETQSNGCLPLSGRHNNTVLPSLVSLTALMKTELTPSLKYLTLIKQLYTLPPFPSPRPSSLPLTPSFLPPPHPVLPSPHPFLPPFPSPLPPFPSPRPSSLPLTPSFLPPPHPFLPLSPSPPHPFLPPSPSPLPPSLPLTPSSLPLTPFFLPPSLVKLTIFLKHPSLHPTVAQRYNSAQ
ncbi:hypothetical protein Pcinc_005947, partial [Petrolisthes cinctipes]